MTAARVIRFPVERTRPEPLVDLRAVMDHYGRSERWARGQLADGMPSHRCGKRRLRFKDAGARARNLALWDKGVEPLRAVDVRKRESA